MHAPEPWESAYRHDPITGAECAVWGADGNIVAMVFANLMDDPDGAMTARLIATAPELLKTLSKIERMTTRGDIKEIARAAIARAEGRE